MTDREPDDLYDALRERLADYGQEPPAPLWANIRAQLPPPVAQPRLRARRRAGVVLLLLLLTASGVGWQWWRARRPNSPATPPLATTTALHQRQPAPQRTPATPAERLASDEQHQLPATPPSPGSAARPADSGRWLAAAGHRPTDSARRLAGTQPPRLSAEPVATGGKRLKPTGPTLALAEPPRGLTGRPRRPLPHSREGGTVARNGRAREAAAAMGAPAAGAKGNAPAASWSRANAGNTALTDEPAGGAGLTAQPSTRGTNRLAAASKAPTLAARRAATARRRTSAPERASASAARRSQAAGPGATPPVAAHPTPDPTPTRPAATALAEAPRAAAHPAPGPPPGARPATASSTYPAALSAGALARQPSRPVALTLANGLAGLPAPQPVAIAPDAPPATRRPRWAVQVLAGPALTYRQLNGAGPPQVVATTSSISTSAVNSFADVAPLERPALGGGAQVSVRRALAGPWTLSAGLGYAEYATRLALRQVRPTTVRTNMSAIPDSTTTSIHRRDTYRFLTLPLRVGYAWPLTPRWQVGLLGGADVAFYAGGSSTEGSACACQTQTWSATNSPYRRVSLGASLGAEVRYRLNGRWELLAQPTATYLLTPLAQATTAFYRRHLLGGTALLGASYTLP